MAAITIAAVEDTAAARRELSELLVAVVAAGGSVSYMHPLAPEDADAFWARSLVAAARGDRVVLGAFDAGRLVGTVSVVFDLPPNQPHRAELAKLMTHPGHRNRGIASALVQAAEHVAADRGRTLLVLDTAADGGAAGLYTRLRYTLTGAIPDYALKPHGGLTATLIFWKRLEPTAGVSPHSGV